MNESNCVMRVKLELKKVRKKEGVIRGGEGNRHIHSRKTYLLIDCLWEEGRGQIYMH